MSSALDTVPGGVITLSSDLRILAANRRLEELVGWPIGELAGELIDVVLTAPSRILFQTHVFPALRADGGVEEVFLGLATRTGETVPVLFNAVRVEASGSVRYDGLIVRIRARARWESELLEATKGLERERAASQRLAEELAAAAQDLAVRHEEERRNREFRDGFVGIVSHELRTPITTIYGMSHLLRERLATMGRDELALHLEDIEAEADRLRRLTEDLLVLSRAEGGPVVVASEPIRVRHVVQSAVDGERRRSPGHAFDLQVVPEPPLVLGDDLHVEQVVRNYLSNAVKYSPPGTRIRVVVAGESGGVSVRVIDAGPGLEGQDSERLFELFYRTPDAARQTSGAGIGLFVCKALVQAMGGRVWAQTAAETGGAEFGFWLPCATDADVGES